MQTPFIKGLFPFVAVLFAANGIAVFTGTFARGDLGVNGRGDTFFGVKFLLDGDQVDVVVFRVAHFDVFLQPFDQGFFEFSLID